MNAYSFIRMAYRCSIFTLIAATQAEEFVEDPVLAREVASALYALRSSPADIDPERKQRAIAYRKRMMLIPGYSKSSIIQDLIFMRDEETIRSFAGKEIPHEVRQTLYECRSPIAIEVLAPLMMNDDGPEPYFGGDMHIVPPSYEVAMGIAYHSFKGTAGLSPELINWGQHYVAAASSPKLTWVETRKIMREWWRENAVHFQTRNYAAAKAPNYVLPDPPPPEYATAGRTPPASTPTQPQPPTTIGTLAPSSSPKHLWNPTPWVIGILLLMLGGLGWWARREPRS